MLGGIEGRRRRGRQRLRWFDGPLLLLPSIFPSIRVFSNESVLCIRWSKCLSFSISPSNEYSELISFKIDQFDLLAVQGTLKSLLQHHSSKPSSLRHSAFFIAQLSRSYTTTGKTTALARASFQVHFFGSMAFCLFLLLITPGEKSVMNCKLTFI